MESCPGRWGHVPDKHGSIKTKNLKGKLKLG